MTKRISVGERLAEDMLAEPWYGPEDESSGVGLLFSASGLAEHEMEGHGYVVMVVTADSAEEARQVGDALIRAGKAARASVIPRVSSMYPRDGDVGQAEEAFLVMKTRMEYFSGIRELVADVRGCESAEIIALPLLRGCSEYLGWAEEEQQAGVEVVVTIGNTESRAWLDPSDIASRIAASLPIASKVSLWGGEVFFPIPVEERAVEVRDVVNLGDVAYWPAGKALLIFLGATPLSRGSEIRPLTPVAVIGRIEAPERLAGMVKAGDAVTIRMRQG
jgi:uncharacterized protein involved in tolerance to divalent cations